MRRGHGERAVRELVERVRDARPRRDAAHDVHRRPPRRDRRGVRRACATSCARPSSIASASSTTRSEEGTVAALLPKRVPQKEIDARRRELLRIQRDISKKKLRALRGRELEVLVEGPSDESEYLLMGRHEGQAPEIDGQVYLSLPESAGDAAAPAAGTLVRARVTHSAEYDLAATIVAERQRARAARSSSASRAPRPRAPRRAR